MYRNIHSGIILKDEEYWAMREREIKQLWEDMNEEERQVGLILILLLLLLGELE